MFFKRIYNLNQLITPGKVLIIYGPRQAGKTTLLLEFLRQTPMTYRMEIGDNIRAQELFSSLDLKRLLEFSEGLDLIAIDEAQYIPQIGSALKLLIDQRKSLTIIATGSSSFELAGQVGEPLTGRKRTIILYPLSHEELHSVFNKWELREKLEEFLLFGTYPEVVCADSRKDKQDTKGMEEKLP